MAAIALNSPIASLAQLDLFRLPPTQGVVERVHYVDKFTSTTDPNSNALDFTIQESGQDFIDLKRTQLEVKVRLLKDGTANAGEPVPRVPIAIGDEVGPVNLFLQSLFSQVDVTINNVRVSASSSNYAYRAYIYTALNYGMEVKDTWLESQLYAKDESVMDSTSPSSGDNRGLQERATYTDGGVTARLRGPLYSDVWQSKRWLIPGVTIKLTLRRNIDKFVLMGKPAKNNYGVEILEAKLNICYCTLFAGAYNALEAALSLSAARYPLTRTIVKNYSLTKGEQSKVFEDIFAGKTPSKLVVCFVLDEAYNGAIGKNPFNFKHFDVSFMCVYCNGVPTPHKGYELIWNGVNKKNSDYVQAYSNLFTFANKKESGSSIDIQRADFCNGHALFVFNLDETIDANTMPLYKAGNLRLEVRFKEKLPFAIQTIVYGQFPYVLSIDKNREIILD